MTNDARGLLRLAAKELVLAAEESDPIKKSHHQEFADRYFAAAAVLRDELALSKRLQRSLGSISRSLNEWFRSRRTVLVKVRPVPTHKVLSK